ncbi:ComEA family DNA-binding protein [Micromonospora cathayae]|uniref:ComEA family DNA-binding protein n=1 Tax=Micromonospora cathayae TaxID=3028804 RepID=A0ABY7ZP87_9ACTN|nr:ComEA family DNA-binding protein [Micromonospora sp. HUAS 3]WDZ84814.1 ComEA family DNA-binding protein [Micromonospora sp. HUAS 3]
MSDDQETEVRQRLWRLLPVRDAVPRLRSTPVGLWDDGADPARSRGGGAGLAGTRGDGAGPVGFRGDGAGPVGFRGDGAGPVGFRGDGAGPVGFRGDGAGPVGFRGDGADDPDGSEPSSVVAGPTPAAGVNRSRLPGPGPFDPGRRGVKALAVVAVLVVLGAGFWAWRSRPRVEPVPTPSLSAVGPLADVATGQPATSGTAELVVAVAGKVRRPGLVRLPAGARVADAIEAAGGAQPGVDVALLNPARRVVDGELIAVGVTPGPAAAAPGGPGAGGPGAGGPGAPGAVPGGKVNLNTATVAQLDTLPGVGPVLAERIIAHRDQQGGFRSVGDLRQVEGIGDARYEQLKDLVTV